MAVRRTHFFVPLLWKHNHNEDSTYKMILLTSKQPRHHHLCYPPSPLSSSERACVEPDITKVPGVHLDHDDTNERQIGKRRRIRPYSRVRFEEVTEIWTDSVPADANLQEELDPESNESSQWYSKEDYDRFKATLILEVKDTLKKYRSATGTKTNLCPIRQAYNKICETTALPQCHGVQGSSNMLLQQDLSTESLQELDLPCHEFLEMVRLEQFVSKQFHRDKYRRRGMLLDAVSEIKGTDWCDELQEAVLRRVCENISGPSRSFALYLGMAAECC